MISITLDTEWCPDPVIDDTLGLLEERAVSATLFSTHEDGVDAASHERALHPNFGREGQSHADALEEVTDAYPDARGLRSHGMCVSSPLRTQYAGAGIEYESNYIHYLGENVEPFWMPAGTVQFPVYFMDDVWLRTKSTPDGLRDARALVAGDGLRVFDFHPVHVYLNTPSIEYYQRHKSEYDDPDALLDARFEGYGTRDAFCEILDAATASDRPIRTLGELFDDYAEDIVPEDP